MSRELINERVFKKETRDKINSQIASNALQYVVADCIFSAATAAGTYNMTVPKLGTALCTIPKGAYIIDSRYFVESVTATDGASATLSLGTTASATAFTNAVKLTALTSYALTDGTITFATGSSVGVHVTADTTLLGTIAATAASSVRVKVIVGYIETGQNVY
jgi:hypothetical protein